MPALTPQITLKVSLDDLSGGAAGSVGNPARVLVALCNFGLQLPRIAGTANLAKIGPYEYLDDGSSEPITIMLWGNDVIVPAGTYYAITILDGNGNVVQTAAYQFTGTMTINLADAVPIDPGNPLVLGVYVVPIIGTAATFDRTKGTGQSLTLTKAVTSSTAVNFIPGAIFPVFIKQDATGGWPFAWPANFQDPPSINPNPNGVSTSMWYAGGDGNFYRYRDALLIDPVAPFTTRVALSVSIAPAGVDFAGINSLVVTAASAVLDALKGRIQTVLIDADLDLTGANNFITGELITLMISQDMTGGWEVTFADEFQAPPTLNLAPNGKTTMIWAADEFGNYYQFGSALWTDI